MQIYLSIKHHTDQRNRGWIESLSAALGARGWQVICAARDLEGWGSQTFDPAELMQHSLHTIKDCHLVLVDLAEKGVGIGIEAGYAYAKGIPILTLAPQDAVVSDTLRGISRAVVRYTLPTDFSALATRIHNLAGNELRLG